MGGADPDPTEDRKRAAARAAALLVPDGARVGLGTGTTVAHLLPALAERGLDLRCVATSPATERAARELGLAVEPFDRLDRLDVAIDGADEIAPDGWLVKGGGGAHLREKVVAAAAERFVVIADDGKLVDRLRGPVPLELRPFGLAAAVRGLGSVRLRDGAAGSRTPDDGVLADLEVDLGDPGAVAARLSAHPGVAAHGLFPSDLVDDVLVADGAGVRHVTVG